MSALPPLSLYIHFPWCVQKCPYCDFNSHALKAPMPERAYIDALLADFWQEWTFFVEPRVIHSIFIGGGTPSLLSPDALAHLLTGIKQRAAIAEQAEITLEANPGTVESGKFNAFRQLGINRLSIGVQSFNDNHLKRLGRIHTAAEAKAAIRIAQQAGFDNVNLDLMFGLPEQTVQEAVTDLKLAIALLPAHLSYYQLTLEPNTYFHQFPPPLPDDDAVFAIQQQAQRLLAAQGYVQYEVSAYAQPDKQCRHNRNYWEFGDYIGIGAGAHGKLTQSVPHRIFRSMKPKHPADYLAHFSATQKQAIAIEDLALEFLMNQLRLRDGFNLANFRQHTGLDDQALQPALAQCVVEGLIIQNQTHYRCTEKGWAFLNTVLEKFIH